MAEYTEGVGPAGPVILKDGEQMSFDAILQDLKRGGPITMSIDPSTELVAQHGKMKEVIQEYITFYDDGLVRSYYTYNKFKEILGD